MAEYGTQITKNAFVFPPWIDDPSRFDSRHVKKTTLLFCVHYLRSCWSTVLPARALRRSHDDHMTENYGFIKCNFGPVETKNALRVRSGLAAISKEFTVN